MGKRIALFAVWFAVVVSVGWCRGEVSNMKVRLEDGKQTTVQQDVKEKTDSWAGWAINKFSGGFGSSQDSAKDTVETIKENVKYAASKSTDTLNSAADETTKYASEKAKTTSEQIGKAENYGSEIGKDRANNAYKMASNMASEAKDDAYNFASNKVGPAMGRAYDMVDNARDALKDKAQNAYEFASKKMQTSSDMGKDGIKATNKKAQNVYASASDMVGDAKEKAKDNAHSIKTNEAIRMVSDKADDVKEMTQNAISRGKDKGFETYEDAKSKVSRPTVDQAKEKYDAAKETVSKGASNIGANMRTGSRVLNNY